MHLHCLTHAELIFLLIYPKICTCCISVSNDQPKKANFTSFLTNFAVTIGLRRTGLRVRGTRGGPRGGVTRPAHSVSPICVAVCRAVVCRQTARQLRRAGPFSDSGSIPAARGQGRPVGGGRESAAAAPHSLFGNRKTRESPASTMSTVCSNLKIYLCPKR